MTRSFGLLLALCALVAVPGDSRAQGKAMDDGPQNRGQISSISDSLKNAGQRELHILYVHGIGATEAADSVTFQRGHLRPHGRM